MIYCQIGIYVRPVKRKICWRKLNHWVQPFLYIQKLPTQPNHQHLSQLRHPVKPRLHPSVQLMIQLSVQQRSQLQAHCLGQLRTQSLWYVCVVILWCFFQFANMTQDCLISYHIAEQLSNHIVNPHPSHDFSKSSRHFSPIRMNRMNHRIIIKIINAYHESWILIDWIESIYRNCHKPHKTPSQIKIKNGFRRATSNEQLR